jgi:phage shock protein PspC (stress-responsive transcriptional regulator)
MSIADEITRLDELRTKGALTSEEFERAKRRVLDGQPSAPSAVTTLNDLRRSREDRWLGGVCGGIADATGVDSWLWRLVFALVAFAGGVGIVIYALLWIFVPQE